MPEAFLYARKRGDDATLAGRARAAAYFSLLLSLGVNTKAWKGQHCTYTTCSLADCAAGMPAARLITFNMFVTVGTLPACQQHGS